MDCGGSKEKQFNRCGCAFTPAFGRAEPIHRAKSRAMNGAPEDE
jgi:hypothetical protein